MYCKKLAFGLTEFSSQKNFSLKRAHAHELIAAYFSFRSKAAMDSSGVILKYANPWAL